MSWKYNGFARIHFNKKEEWPLLASITDQEHNWEVLAKGVQIESGVRLASSHDLEHARPGLDPIWWLCGAVSIEVDDEGIATVRPYEVGPACTTKSLDGILSGIALDMKRDAEQPIVGLADYVPGDNKQHTLYVSPEVHRGLKRARKVGRRRKKNAKRRVRKA